MDEHRLRGLRAQRDHHDAQAAWEQSRKAAQAAQAEANAYAYGRHLAESAMTWLQLAECVHDLQQLQQLGWFEHWPTSAEGMRQRYGWNVQPRRRDEWLAFLRGVAEVHALV